MNFRVSGIYAIRNLINGKVYVGQSVNIHGRWVGHRKHLRKGVHCNPHLQSAWNLYGEEAFVLDVLEVVEDPQKLGVLERDFMVALGSGDKAKGYNLRDADGVPHSMAPETKARIGDANRGKVRSPEMKAHMRKVKKGHGKGRVKAQSEIDNMIASHRDHPRKHSPETLAKISAARKGVPWTQARREAHARQE